MEKKLKVFVVFFLIIFVIIYIYYAISLATAEDKTFDDIFISIPIFDIV